MDNLGDIRLFVEAAQQGSLSAAGRKMGLTPAAASARLAKLETGLKTRLFERTTRQLRLTDEGRLYLNCCRQALQSLDDAEAALQAGQGVVRGKVRISATSDFGRNLLMHWLDEFNALYPEVTFALTLSDSLSNLVQEDIDLAIRFGVPQDSSLIARKLASNRRVLCASPDYIARKGEPKDPNDLANFDCIVLGTASGPANEWRFTRGEEVQHYTVPFETSRETNDGAVAREWARRGYGIVIKSMWDVEADLRGDCLKILLPEWRYPDAPLHALYHRNRFMAPRVRVLLDFLSERFAQVSDELEGLLGLPPERPRAKAAAETASGEGL
ncbi:HTH-type transcriptional regulator DmlR [Paraburkholderia aspalathi]|uniref:HTH-type transcriptional regulator DmlR n=1 Tax=Paraburkholderia aspalathi TaxID=1324617 RepID=A0ABN7KTQ4_9BURK|nr:MULTISPECIES: LysR family transcriptional regulator [Paraburkholderia]MBK3817408.1 LysR family transcriptional regulator [Paraburkholderia aspalathi]MBK3829260.1 LysR family transcriptional regulator [Paraburkholderia aspalathi]MBK3858945.1 LysR family transcriptional regulator [Paraburkholderia aspalathi]MCX4140137.1 LysR family transcriptional regulator [Paraburkholderia aspalathi]MDN7172824.1 LysR family transcriptional regulator [Paraburkholderia sp. SEWSISQ10-3 4]